MPLKDMVGFRTGRLVVLSRAPDGGKEARWNVRCDCGGNSVVRGSRLRKGETVSCGCLVPEAVSASATIHGMTDTRTMRIWRGMISRTSNPKAKDWPRYGGRGIGVCDRWRKSFLAFLEDMGPCPCAEATLDRERNDEGYSKENCRWATMSQQCRNKSNNRIVLYRGREMPLMEACDLGGAGVDWHKARNRIERMGWTVERAVEDGADGRKSA